MKRRTPRLLPSVLAGALIGSLLALGTVSAFGNHVDNLVPFGPPGAREPASIERTDNRGVYYFMIGGGRRQLEQDDRRVVNNMLDSQYRPTDLYFRYDSPPQRSGSGETDTMWREGGVSGSAEGVTWCNDPYGYFRCDQHYIQIEWGSYEQGLSCHEMGHAVGMTHGGDAYPSVSDEARFLQCMQRSVEPWRGLGAHNRGQINANY